MRRPQHLDGVVGRSVLTAEVIRGASQGRMPHATRSRALRGPALREPPAPGLRPVIAGVRPWLRPGLLMADERAVPGGHLAGCRIAASPDETPARCFLETIPCSDEFLTFLARASVGAGVAAAAALCFGLATAPASAAPAGFMPARQHGRPASRASRRRGPRPCSRGGLGRRPRWLEPRRLGP